MRIELISMRIRLVEIKSQKKNWRREKKFIYIFVTRIPSKFLLKSMSTPKLPDDAKCGRDWSGTIAHH